MPSVQFTGLASGLDTDSIVKAMLINQQSKIDKMKQNKTQTEWKQEQWKVVNKSINEFYSKYVDKLKSKATYQKYKSTSSDYAVGITNTLDMPVGTHKIEVEQLATQINKAANVSEIFNSKTKSFKELGILPDGASTTMTVNNIDIEITESDSLSTLERKIKNADSSLNVNFDINNHKLFISSKNSGIEAKLNIELGTDTHSLYRLLGLAGENGICKENSVQKTIQMADDFDSSKTFEEMRWMTGGTTSKININGYDITVNSNDKLEDVKTQIESATGNKVKMDIDSVNKSFRLSNTKSDGTEAELKLKVESGDDDQHVFDKLGITGIHGICDVASPNEFIATNNTWNVYEIGTGAKYKYNGIAMTSDTNNVEVNGLKLTLREETTGRSPVVIEVENDPDEVVSFIKDFVEGYNKLISDLNEKYDAVNVKLNPLTEDEKEGMTDKQIEKYEENIKGSLLRRDSNLKNVLDTLRKSLQSFVKDNPYGSLSSIGITTGEYYENGKLHLDEDKLRKAVQENPSAVSELFAGSGTTYETIDSNGRIVNKIKENTTGIGTNMYNAFLDMKKRIQDVKSYESYYNDKIVTKELTTYTNNIKALEKKYEALKSQYYKKFTAMEKALSQINLQGSSLTSMLGQ